MENEFSTAGDGTSEQPSLEAAPLQTEAPAPESGGESFLNDEDIMAKIRSTPELEHVFKKMQGAYTRKTQSIASVRDAASLVERFNSDPEFARQTILQRAAQLGLNIANPSHQAGQPMSAAQSMPPQLVEAVKANLSPELQWMAPALAASQWAGMQMALKPLEQQQAQLVGNTRDQQYEQLAEQLSEKAPGWEQHEEDMDSLLSFLQSPKMTDRRWGSKLELLYRLSAGQGQATAEAARRMAQAGRFHAPAGQPKAAPQPNVAEMVKKPKQNQDAWDAAARYAMSELQRQGIKVS